MFHKKIKIISLATLTLIGGLSLGAIGSIAFANNSKKHATFLSDTVLTSSTNFSFLEDTSNTQEEKPQILSYVNYTKDKISDVIRVYAILENCQIKDNQKDEIIYYLSEYVTSSVQAGKFTNSDLKEEYINFAQSFQPPHPTSSECLEAYDDAKDIVIYWNDKKNTAFNELFSIAKNRYSPEPEENVDVIEEVINIQNKNNIDYSLTYPKRLPWAVNTHEIFQLENKPSKSIDEDDISNIIPDLPENTNHIATINNKEVSDPKENIKTPNVLQNELEISKKTK